MRSKALIVACVVTVAATAFGAGSIISSFRSPCSYPVGMSYHNGYLYHMSWAAASGTIYQTTTTGSVVRSVTAPAGCIGVDFGGTYFWVASYSTPFYVSQLTTAGSVLRSFAGPAAGYGIAFDGTYLWFSSARSGNMIYQLTTAGSRIKSFSGPGSFNGGLDWDARGYLWLADWPPSGGGVFRITTAGSVVESYRPVPTGGRPSGCAWDGSYVWYCNNVSPMYVYQMTTVISSVLPASLGKVKAIFR